MSKYWTIFKINWQASLEYRFNFILGRLQNIILLLTLYYLWTAVIPQTAEVFGYSQDKILTYVLGAHFLRSLILETRTKYIGEQMYNGDLNFFLTKPINLLWMWLAEDFARKALTVLTAALEVAVFVLVAKPVVFIQTDLGLAGLTLILVGVAAILNFVANFVASLVGFWSENVYGPHFLIETVIDFASGSLFPLDILPGPLFAFFKALPFYYVLFFPLKVYLGQVALTSALIGLGIQLTWLAALFLIYQFVWSLGLKRYSAVGG